MIDSALTLAAKAKGATVIDRGNGHVQIHGKLLVNYYPLSRTKTAYVAGTKAGRKHVSPEQAVAMAFEPPQISKDRDKRKGGSRAKRYAMLKKHNRCHWCDCLLNLDLSTIDHVIPLARGGLDNANNRVLSCLKCNQFRACNMPEVRNG